MKLQYATKNKSEISDLSALQAILAPHNIILDAEYLVIMEQAEEGNMESVAEMFELFLEGTNAFAPNYPLAKRYMDKAIEIIEPLNDEIAMLEVMTNEAIMETRFEHYETSKALLKKAVSFMLDNYEYKDVFAYVTDMLYKVNENTEYLDEEPFETE